jgi:PPOX class probable F420-dependent enzyme
VAVVELPASARELIASGQLAHVVTLGRDGAPQVTCVWVGLEGGELVSGHLGRWQKIRNVERDPRVSLSLESARVNSMGLKEYLVVHGEGYVTEGGAPELLQRLARVYLGPEVTFPPMDDPPAGFVLHIVPRRIGGVGPWVDESRG